MDTISIILNKERVPNINLLMETPQYLTSVSSEGISFGKPMISGKLNNFNVIICEDKIKIKDASLTKYLYGNNLTTMSRASIKQALEKMSDALHIPIKKAEVLKFHYAKNIMLNHNVSLYLPYLGQNTSYKRLEQPSGINYKLHNKEFVIYDKIKELKYHREPIHPMYQNRNVIRLESRYEKQLYKEFNLSSITANMLYNEEFYMIINDKWYCDYSNIDKLKINKIDMEQVTTKRQMELLGVLSLIELQGGKVQALLNLKERYIKKQLTKKQHYDLKALIEQSSQMKLQTIESDLIIELNQKVNEAIKYYL